MKESQLETAARERLLALYRDLDLEIEASGVQCQASGRCCRFTEYGHTLFLSKPEADLLLTDGVPKGSVISRDCCPFQIGGLCTARERRPIGCRVYFCDLAHAERQNELSERFIGRLKQLHREESWPWDYRPLHQFLGVPPTGETLADRAVPEGQWVELS